MENTCEYLHDYLYCHARCVKMRPAETLAPPLVRRSVCSFITHWLTGIVSKRLNVSSKFFHAWYPHLCSFCDLISLRKSVESSQTRVTNTEMVWKLCDFRLISRCILETMRDEGIVTTIPKSLCSVFQSHLGYLKDIIMSSIATIHKYTAYVSYVLIL